VRPRSLLLVRHGESEWNAAGRWQGQADPPLSARGREQAEALATSLHERPIVAVHASDLVRARQTAQPIAAALGLPLLLDRALRERHVGAFAGLTHEEVRRRHPEWQHALRHDEGRPPGGETRRELRARVGAAIARIERQAPPGELVIVSHGAAIRAALEHLRGQHDEHEQRLHVANCQVIVVTLGEAGASFTGLDGSPLAA
jgi:probable phosphoglycerate mutase